MLYSVLASSAIVLAGLIPVNALVTPGSGSELGHLAARRLGGVSPSHHGLARRKRNAHKKRQRCQQRPVTVESTPAPQQTGDYSGGNDYGGGDDNSGGNDNSGNTYPSNPTTTQPATQPATTQPPSPPATGDGKLILAWPNGAEPSMSNYFTGKARFYYTWSPWKVDGNTGNVRFCPMLWGYKHIYDFTQLVKPGYADCAMGMNEVNQHDQAAMSVGEGVDMWNQYIGPLASQGYNILVSPATTSAPDGLPWVQQWLEQVWVKPNIIAVHFYDVGFEKFQTYVTNFYQGAGYRDIWVTEYACQNFNGGPQCSHDEIWAFVTQTTSWMDSTDWIKGYAPFGFMRDMVNVNPENRLMNYDGSPTDLGNFFIWSS